MKRKSFLHFLYVAVVLFAAACTPLTPSADQDGPPRDGDLSPTPTVFVPTPTATLVPELTPIVAASLTPTPGPLSAPQFLAYSSNGQLLVTDVTNGVQGGTTQYTVAGESDQVTDLVWSPSGEFVAFVSAATGIPHVFYIAFIGGAYPDDNISVTTIENPSPRQLTFESNYAWGRPVFTPDGNSLVVAGVSRDNMGAQGNTSFTLQSLALDGSGGRATLPGATPLDGARLPQDLHFSPNGLYLAFSTSYHWNACASPGAYYVSDAIGGNRQELISPSLKLFVDPNMEHFHVGLSYAWSPHSDGLVALGNVIDCNLNSPTAGKVIAGPQISILRMDGTEGYVIPGFFYGISMNRSGTLIATAHFQDGFQDLNPTVEIYSAQTGQLVLPLGPGSNPQFQP